ncbi:LpxI family protein [Celeribacter indicus]|uniref:Phosphatidate cytidyltransferase n=1 Tax=Celeribacter indicus TaxID=1208324 RepID=A0A0B5E2S0_9RHOB|nr:UDP-2,3-diacylglucosamine diphosphatase LpxI [Celeribacter indicus]AJE47326.1 hypothetical protein P73_2611 [Celeribacter indicus]SDW03541.1 hypothetical protein SAMN05443573_101167 [Celeribacter indicus]
MGRAAIIAGSGTLPRLVAAALEAPVYVTLDGASAPEGATHVSARIEKLGRLFKDLRAQGVTEVTFAGAMVRPKINPVLLDRHALRLAMSLGKGDDALLREVLALFAEQGFTVRGAAELCPDLTLPSGTHWGHAPSPEETADTDRAQAVLDALSPLDVGQGAVCAGGQMLGIETVQGTDALLRFVAQTPERLRRAKGVFVKAPKRGQDLRVDMPTIGPETVAAAIAAGLGGIVIPGGAVIVIERDRVRHQIEEAGMFLSAQ